MCAQSLSRVQLCDSMDRSQPGSSVHGSSQARILEWVIISFFRGSADRGLKLESRAFAGRSFTIKPPGKSTGKETPIQRQFILSYCK